MTGLAWFATPLPAAEASGRVDEDPEFVEARQLFWSGRYEDAEAKFKTYLAAHPKHEATRSFLQMIAQSRIHDRSKIDLTRKRLDGIQVEKIEFKDADWRDVAAFLQDLANPKENGKDPRDYVNFINMLPSGFSLKVSLDLRNVSLLRAIEHASHQAGLTYVVDTWAVIFELPHKR